MTKPLYLFAIACVLSLQLCTIALAQDTTLVEVTDLDLNFETLGNEEWNEGCETELDWQNEEWCSWDEENDLDILDADDTLITPVDTTTGIGKAIDGCQAEYTIVQGDICDQIAQNNGLSVDQLTAINEGIDCANLQVGESVCVKGPDAAAPPTETTPPAEPTEGVPAPSGDINISFDQFTQAVSGTQGYPAPSEDQYNSFINNYGAGDISSTRELAMFLSEIIWESGGLQYKSEIACEGNNCAESYRSEGDDPNKFYYGRGYIQLSWSYNYKAASEALYGDDRLVTDPDQVATNEDVAWQTAFWYWKANVHTAAGVQEGQFGSATNAINGALECNPCQGNCPKRNEIYAHVLQVFGVNEEPNTAGC